MVQLVKLGGSVLTDKAGEPTVRADVLERLAGELAGADDELVLVHGAGSFGHPVAAEADLVHGAQGPQELRAVARVHADVRRLNLAVLDALREAGLDPVAFPPFGSLGMSAGKAGSWNLVPLHRSLGMGLTPVTFGDVVLDTARGVTIAGGDVLMVELARFLRPTRVLFVLDEDGLYDRPPTEPGATLLEAPTLEELESAQAEAAGEPKGPDVTGGVAAKLEAVRRMAPFTQAVGLVNGLEPDRLANALRGKVQGTLVPTEVAP